MEIFFFLNSPFQNCSLNLVKENSTRKEQNNQQFDGGHSPVSRSKHGVVGPEVAKI